MLIKMFWSVFTMLMVVLLILASCGPRGAPTSTPVPVTPAPIPAAPTPAPVLTPPPASSVEKPKYGGTINLMQRLDIRGFLAGTTTTIHAGDIGGLVYEQMTNVDWTLGPAGTGETSFGEFFAGYGAVRSEDVIGWLADSFKTPEIGVWIFEIRRGVHYALDPKSEASRLANGREMTADDVVASFNQYKKYYIASRPEFARNLTAEKTGPWQVTVRTPVDPGSAFVTVMGGGAGQHVWPKEVVEQYWKTDDWRHAVGTGPFMLTDYVVGSVATFTRNPNYWKRNPLGPGKGDQLPYPDTVKILVVPDISTRMASLRTGKADWMDEVQLEDARSLLKTTPNLQSKRYLPYLSGVAMRTDKEELPYKDVRVRQALHLAIDFEAIKNDLYRGQAQVLVWPVAEARGTEKLFIPMEKLPESAQALFKYNPARAKQLLAEAGYPSGFKAKIIVVNTSSDIDVVSVLKEMWAKVGVDLEIQPREASIINSIRLTRTHEEMFFTTMSSDLSVFSHRYGFSAFRPNNTSYVNVPAGKDPVIEAAFQEMQKNIMINWPKADQIIRDLIPYIVEQAHYIVPPAPYTYRIWQPWLKGYYGEAHYRHWIPYAWVDQDLKEQMTGRR